MQPIKCSALLLKVGFVFFSCINFSYYIINNFVPTNNFFLSLYVLYIFFIGNLSDIMFISLIMYKYIFVSDLLPRLLSMINKILVMLILLHCAF